MYIYQKQQCTHFFFIIIKMCDSNSLFSCDICYDEVKDRVTLECKHELCIRCFLKVITPSYFKCHMCRRKYNWTYKTKEKPKEDAITLEETLSILIREDDENQFLSLVGSRMSKAFEVIVNNQNVIQFIVILEAQIDKLLISEFIANNYTSGDIIRSLRNPSFSHFRNTNSHLESYFDNLIIKKIWE